MFGCICSGRPVQTNLQAVSPSQFLFVLPSAQLINHIVVFLLPDTALPEGHAASVYIQWPGQEFRLLGGLSMQKPSAIFRVRGNNNTGGSSNTNNTNTTSNVHTGLGAADDAMMAMDSMGGGDSSGVNTVSANAGLDVSVQLGISVEPLAQVESQLATLGEAGRASAAKEKQTTVVHARRIIQNAFNYLSSFSQGTPGHEVVPMKAFQEWWNKFEKKIELDPGFLDREEG